MLRLAAIVLVLLAAAWPGRATAQDLAPAEVRYYVVVFGYQDQPNTPRDAHTFATFIKLTGTDDPASPQLEAHTISWIPANYAESYRVGVTRRRGHNYTLGETMSFAADRCFQVCRCGPFEIDCCLYTSALKQIQFLNSGRVAYKFDAPLQRLPAYVHRRGGALNCIEAVADVGGYVETWAKYGCRATRAVAEHYSPHYVNCHKQPWVYDLLVNQHLCHCGGCQVEMQYEELTSE